MDDGYIAQIQLGVEQNCLPKGLRQQNSNNILLSQLQCIHKGTNQGRKWSVSIILSLHHYPCRTHHM
jgi:hypothetical protein